MRLIIAGGRNYHIPDIGYFYLNKLRKQLIRVINGGAQGVDTDARIWARNNNIPIEIYRPDWKTYGKVAGPLRNRLMAQHADVVALFSGGKGTESMFQEAKKQGLMIYDWREER